MENRAAHTSLYPDLREFYTEGLVETGSSIDLPFLGLDDRVMPTAPPAPSGDGSGDLELNIQTPEEPEEDYLFELEPDYDLDNDEDVNFTLNNLNLNAKEKKILHDKNIEVPERSLPPPPPRDSKDFRAWMTWRMQANRLLAAVILIRQGRHVHVRQSEIRRKPLTKQNVEVIVQEARGDRRRLCRDRAEKTSLPECPYIMYGIPRAKLATAGQ